MLKVDILQVFVSAASIFGIGLIWINFNEKVFQTICHLISALFTWPEEKERDSKDDEFDSESCKYDCQNCRYFENAIKQS